MANAGKTEAPDKSTREDRLAAKLRENLRRRKAQARAVAGTEDRIAPSPQSGKLPESP